MHDSRDRIFEMEGNTGSLRYSAYFDRFRDLLNFNTTSSPMQKDVHSAYDNFPIIFSLSTTLVH